MYSWRIFGTNPPNTGTPPVANLNTQHILQPRLWHAGRNDNLNRRYTLAIGLGGPRTLAQCAAHILLQALFLCPRHCVMAGCAWTPSGVPVPVFRSANLA